MKDFGFTAATLARNPLGIIALFIVLVYGIASLVLGLSPSLPNEQKEILVWFLVLFPVAVLLCFLRLVTKHHMKLYAPTDFKDEEGFFRSQAPEEQKKRIEAEVNGITQSSATVNANISNTESKDIATGSLHQMVFLATELVLREIQLEYGSPISRAASLGKDLGFDGMFAYKGKGYGVEVKFVRDKINQSRLVEQLKAYSNRITSLHYKKFNIILAFVTDHADRFDDASTIECLNSLSDSLDFKLEVRVFELDKLRNKYGVANK